MKVCLINPPPALDIVSGLPMKVEKWRGIYPNLGLGYIAAVLEKQGHEVSLIDMGALAVSMSDLEKCLADLSPQVVGLSFMTPGYLTALQIAKVIKLMLPQVPLLAGGVHATIYPKETVSNVFDIAVRGEGEHTILDVIDALENNRSLNLVEGIAYRENGEIYLTPKRPLIENLDDIPFPAYHLMPMNEYFCSIAKKSGFTTMVASRGCPFNCAFCHRPQFGRIFRARSAQNVVDEIKYVSNKFNIQEIMFYDDSFTVDKRRVIEICKGILDRHIVWDCRTRVDLVDEELLGIMHEAGCYRIHFGVESAHPTILKNLNKRITLEQARKAFKWAKKVGMETLAYFMIGNPGDTPETIVKSIEFAKELKADFAHFTMLTPYPGTGIYQEALKEGIIKEDFWRSYALGEVRTSNPPIYENEGLDEPQLNMWLKRAYRSFYFRPFYAFKRLLSIRSWRELKYYLRGTGVVLKL